MKLSPGKLKFGINIFPPYLGAGIKVKHISDDWRETHVEMKLRWYNRNFVGTHFGGSLYSMVDPHLMLMLIQILGKEFIVWDKSAIIHFIKPGKSIVKSVIKISENDLVEIKKKTLNGQKYLPEFNIRITDENGDTVAEVKKVLYIRKNQS